MIFSVVGGDMRQVHLMDILLDNGQEVKAIGFEGLENKRIKLYNSLTPDFFDCDVLFLPIPYKNKTGKLNIKQANMIISLEEIEECLEANKPWVVLGKADKEFEELARSKGLNFIDITQEESFAILNAIPTAEGAIQRAMEMTDITIHRSKVLVMGYGRIGKSLSRMLRGIGAKVTVEARKEEDLSWILENGYKPVHLKDLETVLPDQDIIFNTIPHLILDKEKLTKINKRTVIIDVSSYPGGVDFDAAKELGIKTSLDLGLPGIVAPRTSAEIIYKIMMDYLQERMT
ncbi:MAG: dipicolinate synthase subunit DpsA [Clostridiales bacterium]|nr:dipicolinate synthase subunit DpsA [Clostridiales bacterium]